MAEENEPQEKTEEPSQRKLEQAKEDGKVLTRLHLLLTECLQKQHHMKCINMIQKNHYLKIKR